MYYNIPMSLLYYALVFCSTLLSLSIIIIILIYHSKVCFISICMLNTHALFLTSQYTFFPRLKTEKKERMLCMPWISTQFDFNPDIITCNIQHAFKKNSSHLYIE